MQSARAHNPSNFFGDAGIVNGVKTNPTVQTSIPMGKPGDKYETEADAMADKVMQMPSGKSASAGAAAGEESGEAAVNRTTVSKSISTVQRKEGEETAAMMPAVAVQRTDTEQASPKCAECAREDKNAPGVQSAAIQRNTEGPQQNKDPVQGKAVQLNATAAIPGEESAQKTDEEGAGKPAQAKLVSRSETGPQQNKDPVQAKCSACEGGAVQKKSVQRAEEESAAPVARAKFVSRAEEEAASKPEEEKPAASAQAKMVSRAEEEAASKPDEDAPAAQPKMVSRAEEEAASKPDEDAPAAQPKMVSRAEEEAASKPDDEAPAAQAKCAGCAAEESAQKAEEEPAQPKGGGNASSVPAHVEGGIKSSKGSGSPLPGETRDFMESRFDADFSSVRVHNDGNAASMTRDIGAQAFAHGSDIYFAPGKYDTTSTSGNHLLAHELTHTIQQGGAARGRPVAMKEEEVAKSSAPGEASHQVSKAPVSVQRLFGLFEEDPCAEKKKEPDPKKNEEAAKDAETTRIEKDCRHKNPEPPQAPEGTAEPDQDQQPAGAEANPGASLDERQGNAPGPDEVAPGVDPNSSEKAAQNAQGPCAGQAPAIKAGAGAAGAAAGAAMGGGAKAAAKGAADKKEKGPADAKAGAKGGAAETQWLKKAATARMAPGIKPGGKGEASSPDLLLERNEAKSELASSQGLFAATKSGVEGFDLSGVKFLPAEKGDQAAQADEGAANAAASDFAGFGQTLVLNLLSSGEQTAKAIQNSVAQKKKAIQATIRARTQRAKAQSRQSMAQATTKAAVASMMVNVRHMMTSMQISMKAGASRLQANMMHMRESMKLHQKGREALAALEIQYSAAERNLRSIGATNAAAARSFGEKRATAYMKAEGATNPDVIEKVTKKKKDGFWDGYLTYNRYEARADAARETAKQYAEGFEDQAKENADAIHCGKGQDIKMIEGAVVQGETNLKCVLDQTLAGISEQEKAALEGANETKKEALTGIADSKAATVAQIREKEAAQIQFLNDFGARQQMGIERDALKGTAAILQQTSQGAEMLMGVIQGFAGSVKGSRAPPGDDVTQVTSGMKGMLEAQAQGAKAGISTAESGARAGVDAAFTTANTALSTFSDQSLQEVRELTSTFSTTIDTMSANVATGFTNLSANFAKQQGLMMDNASVSMAGVVTGVEGIFAQIRQGTQTQFDASATNMKNGFEDKVKNELPFKICTEAEAAAKEVQPWWKTALKILLVIIVVVVVALVIGPAVIGAVGAAASALAGSLGAGAALAGTIGAWVGPIIGGAIVGAFSGAVIQLGNNIIDGKDLMHGMKQAIIAGAIGGALGGLGGQFAQVLVKGGGVLAGLGRFGIETAFDAVGNILGDVANGVEFNLNAFLTNMAIGTGISVGMRGFGKFTQTSKAKVTEANAGATPGGVSRVRRLGAWLDNLQTGMAAKGENFGAKKGSFGSKGPDVQSTRAGLADARQRISEGEAFPIRDKKPAQDGGGTETHTSDTEAGGNTRTTQDQEGTNTRAPGDENSNQGTKTNEDGSETSGTRNTAEDPESVRVTAPEESLTGIRTQIDLPDGHKVRVLDNGTVWLCSPVCMNITEFYQRYSSTIQSSKKIQYELAQLAKKADMSNIADLEQRVELEQKIREEHYGNADENIKPELDEVSNTLHEKQREWLEANRQLQELESAPKPDEAKIEQVKKRIADLEKDIDAVRDHSDQYNDPNFGNKRYEPFDIPDDGLVRSQGTAQTPEGEVINFGTAKDPVTGETKIEYPKVTAADKLSSKYKQVAEGNSELAAQIKAVEEMYARGDPDAYRQHVELEYKLRVAENATQAPPKIDATQAEINAKNNFLPENTHMTGNGKECAIYDSRTGELLGTASVEDGYVSLAVYTKDATSPVKGKDVLLALVKNLELSGANFKGIRGIWGKESDNTASFNRAISEGASENDAIFTTFTGHVLKKYFGYDKGYITNRQPDTGPPFTKVDAVFYK